jgi:hypothetical protein
LGDQQRAATPREIYVWEVNYHDQRDPQQMEQYRSKSLDCRNWDKYPQENNKKWEEHKREHACPNILEIRTIIGGFDGGGELGRARKAYT